MRSKQIATEDLWVEVDGVRRLAARAGKPIPPEFLPFVDEEATTPQVDAPPRVDEIDSEGVKEYVEAATPEELCDVLVAACGHLAAHADQEVDEDLIEKTREALGRVFGDEVTVPDGVVPGETPGWPVDAATGKVLRLPDQVREELAKIPIGESSGDDDLEALDPAELREKLKDLGVTPKTRATKEQLIQQLREAQKQ